MPRQWLYLWCRRLRPSHQSRPSPRIASTALTKMLVLGLVLGAPPLPAAAQSSRRVAELQRSVLGTATPPHPQPRWTFAAAVWAAAGAELRPGGANRGVGQTRLEAELAYEGRACRYVEAGAAVDLLVGPGEQAPGIEQWLRGCLVASLPLPSLELDHRLEWRPQPALDAPRLLPAGRYLQESLGLTLTMLELPGKEHERAQIGHTRVGTRFVVHETPQDVSRFELQTALLRYALRRFGPHRGSDYTVEIGLGEVQVAQGDRGDALAMSLLPLRMRGRKLGTPHLLLDATLGLGGGEIATPSDPRDADQEPKESTMDVTPIFELALYGGVERLAGGLGVQRRIWPTQQDELLAETRATAWVRYRQPRFVALLDGFFALSDVYPLTGADAEHLTGGGRLQLSWSPVQRVLGRHGWQLWLTLTGELARSFYAHAAAAPDAPPALGARVMASVSARFDLGPRR